MACLGDIAAGNLYARENKATDKSFGDFEWQIEVRKILRF